MHIICLLFIDGLIEQCFIENFSQMSLPLQLMLIDAHRDDCIVLVNEF